jgi:HD-GYP domain-containing protein (c-di-GMP phosphodiesterase class II)
MSGAQHIRVDQLKLGSRLAGDVLETGADGQSVLLYAAGQVINTEWQLSRLRESGALVVPVAPDSVREPVATFSAAEHRALLMEQRRRVDDARPAEAHAEAGVLRFLEQIQTGSGHEVDQRVLLDQVDHLSRQGRQSPELLDVLCLLREASPRLFRHSRNVASLALRVSLYRQPDVSDEDLRRVVMAGLLHDVGMVHCLGLDQLNEGEVDETSELFRDHPDFGVGIVLEMGGVPTEVRRVVAEHHERLHGNGFPNELGGRDIHPMAELIGLCDTYERLTHGITYRRALSPVAALNLIQGWARREFHEELVLAFTRALGPWPIGAPVELDNGLKGRVMSRVNPFAPLVACRAADGGLQLVDCAREGLSVRRGLAPAQAELHPTEIF